MGAANLTAESESFDINGNKSSSKTFTDSASKTVTNQTQSPGWAQAAVTVSKFGLAVSSKDQAGIEVSFEYDALGRKIKTTDPRAGASLTHFDAKGRVDYVADAAGFKTELGYDDVTGRKVWEKNASGKFTRYAYDVKGRMTKTWGDSVYPVAYSYDETGRMVSMTTYRADTGWNVESFPENATGDTTKWHYDPSTGLLLAKEYADGTKTEYRYAEAGRLDTRTWARKSNGNSPFEGGLGDVATKYLYDPSTAALNKIDYSDETADITFAYDRIGRQKSVTDAVGTRTFAYNDSLQLWKESIDGLTSATITRLYETDGVKGRPKGFTIEKSGASAGGGSLPLPQGEGRGEGKYEVSYGYDPSGRIRTLSWNAGGKADSATYEYIENSHLLSSMKTGSGLTASYTYEDHRNVKTAVSNSFGNTAVSTYTYEYDELGRRKSVKNTGSAFTNANFNIYGYNDRSEVTASNSFTGEDLANKNNPLSDRSRAYNYDPIGNRKSATEAANNLTYTANSLNQYESITGGANPETPAYDADGNMTVSKGMVYNFNAENRLIEAAPQNPQQGSVKSTYIYDYMGRRARKTLYTYSSGSWQKQKDISFIYDGWNMVKEIEKASDSSPEVPVYYVWGLDLSQSMQGAGGVGGLIASVKSGNEYLYSYDGNGNVGQMVKSSDGSIAARYEYDPFGKTLFSEGPMASENSYRFSTKYQDVETGFYYYGFRYYDVEMGRWINRDPIEEDGGLNLYHFVSNSSNNQFDINGLATVGQILKVANQLGIFNESIDLEEYNFNDELIIDRPNNFFSKLIIDIQNKLNSELNEPPRLPGISEFGNTSIKKYMNWARIKGKTPIEFERFLKASQVLQWIVDSWPNKECVKKCPKGFGEVLSIVYLESKFNEIGGNAGQTYKGMRGTAVGLAQILAGSVDKYGINYGERYKGAQTIKGVVNLISAGTKLENCEFSYSNPKMHEWQVWTWWSSEIQKVGKKINQQIEKNNGDINKISDSELMGYMNELPKKK